MQTKLIDFQVGNNPPRRLYYSDDLCCDPLGRCPEAVWFMVFAATFNNISIILWRSVSLLEQTRTPGENHWPDTSHWQTLSHNVLQIPLILIGTAPFWKNFIQVLANFGFSTKYNVTYMYTWIQIPFSVYLVNNLHVSLFSYNNIVNVCTCLLGKYIAMVTLYNQLHF